MGIHPARVYIPGGNHRDPLYQAVEQTSCVNAFWQNKTVTWTEDKIVPLIAESKSYHKLMDVV